MSSGVQKLIIKYTLRASVSLLIKRTQQTDKPESKSKLPRSDCPYEISSEKNSLLDEPM